MTDMHSENVATPESFALELQDAPDNAAAVHVRSGDLLGGLGKLHEVWKYGGGTQSVAIAALILQGKLPRPDIAIIADTGKERSSTWQYLDAVVTPKLAEIGMPIIRAYASDHAYYHEGVYNRKGTLLIPAFTNAAGVKGMMDGYCNKWWKQDVVNNWLRRERGIRKEQVRSWIGFSADEWPRVHRMKQGEEYQAGRIRFPLVELGLRRRDSIALVEAMGWPTPPRSACYMCPNQTDAEWRDLKYNHPAEFALAVQEEREMQKRDPNYWLHDSCQPLDTVDFTRPDDLFWRACDPKEGAACFT